MIAVPVSSCRDCPFAFTAQRPGEAPEPWICVVRPVRTIGVPGPTVQMPPDWCPLLEADRLVTLRVS